MRMKDYQRSNSALRTKLKLQVMKHIVRVWIILCISSKIKKEARILLKVS